MGDLIEVITNFCDARYQLQCNKKCSSGFCNPTKCASCLYSIHFTTDGRAYDCEHMADVYVCKYSHKYTSEMIYALEQLRDLREKKHLNVLSIGCGPCTDLFALDYVRRNSIYTFDTLDYRGVEINPTIWRNIYQDIFQEKPNGWMVSIIPKDICTYVDSLLQDEWRPDLISLQYVFSDMQKHTEQSEITRMISSLAQYIDTCSENTYVVCNDINLSIQLGGGREYFDELVGSLRNGAQYYQYHFYNSNKENHYEYGYEYGNNALRVQPQNNLSCYEPFLSCASAQILIKKGAIV